MKISLNSLYSKLNGGVSNCPLACTQQCKVKEKSILTTESEHSCPLSLHQAETCAEVLYGDAEVIFNLSATGDGKSLAAFLATFLEAYFRVMGLYPTNALVDDQYRQQKDYHKIFKKNYQERVEQVYGAALAHKIKNSPDLTNKFQELIFILTKTPIILTNPDIFHLITHFRYQDIAYEPYLIVDALARNIDLWVFDEFHIFGAHQEIATINSLLLIRETQQRKRKFLFTSATPKDSFIKMLKQAGFKTKLIGGKDYHSNQKLLGFRPILQKIELNFIQLEEFGTLNWLQKNLDEIKNYLMKEVKGRGLIIVNSVALAGKIVRELKSLLEPHDIRVEEISGRISKKEREKIYEALKNESRPVLVVGTSAVDVGVDFELNLLIFESSDVSTVIQRLGRLGRHPRFKSYQAFILISQRTPWIYARLEAEFESEKTYSRFEFQEKLNDCFPSSTDFWQYHNRWGFLQAQGMLHQMTSGGKERAEVMKPIKERMNNYMKKINLIGTSYDKCWKYNPDVLRKKIQEQLLSFRGSSNLQAAVWDISSSSSNFYTYDLLRLLPYTLVEVINRETFIQQAVSVGHIEEEFLDEYIQVYLKLNQNSWLNERQIIEIKCKKTARELQTCTLTLLNKISITNHPQELEISQFLRHKELLAFLIPLGKKQLSDLYRMLYLNPTFGLYQLTDLDQDAYACAFNHNALLLEALSQTNKELKNICLSHTQSYFF